MAADISTLALEVDSTAVVRARGDLDSFSSAGGRSASVAEKTTGAWRAFAGVMASLGLGLAIREVVQIADKMSLLDARLKLVTGSSREFLAAQTDIYRIAQQNNVGIEETTQLYVKLSKPIKDIGGSSREVAGITDAFAKSLRLGGASAQEASSATLQFAQAMASGKLSGDEFRSLAEASPRFMQALADGMGVSTGALKQMSTESKLTADVVGNALLKSLGQLTQEAASMPDTVGGAFTRLANDAKTAIGELNKSSGMTLGIAEGIEAVRSLIPSIKSEIQGVVSTISDFLDRNKQSIGDAWNSAIGLGSSLWEVAKAVGSIVGFFTEVVFQSGVVKTTIEAVRIIIAGVIDGVTFLGGVLATIGSLILKGITAPLQATLTVAANIAGLFDGDMAAKIQGINASIKDFAGAGAKYGDEVAAKFMNGETAIGRLNAELANANIKTKSVASEATKLSNAFGSLGGSGGGKDSAPAKISEYEKLITSIKEKIALQEAELTRGRELTKAEQLAATVTADLASGKLKLNKAQKESIDSAIALYDSTERLNEAKRSSAKLYEQSLSSAIKENQTIQQQIDALKLQTEEIGKSEFALALLAEARLYDAAAQKDAMASMADGEDLTGRLGELYREQATALRDLAAAKLNFANVKDSNDQGIKSLSEATKQMDEFQSYIDKIDSSRLDGLFNGALKGVNKLITSVEAFGKLQTKTDSAKEAANKKLQSGQITQIQYEKELDGIKQDSWRANIALTQQSLSAIQSMTKEGSSAYKAMEVAQAALGATTAIAAIANQGLGDPYTAIPRILAMAATMAQLGFAVNGLSGGGGSAPTNKGTGTVFGDSEAKSASIENSIDLLADTSQLGLRYSAQMANSLKNIEAAMGGVTSLLLRGGQLGDLASSIPTGVFASSTSEFGNKIFGGQFASLRNKLFGNKVSIKGTGISGEKQSLGSIDELGFQGNYYADVVTEKKFLGITRKTTNSTVLEALDEQMAQQFGLIFRGLGDTVTAAAGALGSDLVKVGSDLDNYIVDIGKIDLNGLKGTEIQEKLAAVFGAEGDKLAQAVIGGLEPIQKVGEGYLETLVRAANQLEVVNQNSIRMADGFRAVGIAGALTVNALVEQFGGLEEYTSATDAFFESFFSSTEKTNATLNQIVGSLDAFNISLPANSNAWREMTLGMDRTTEGGRAAYEALIRLGPAFSDLQNQLLDAAGISASSVSDVIRDGLLGRATQEDIGGKLSGVLKTGLENALATGVADQITASITNNIIAPMLQSILLGGDLAAAASQANIDEFISKAQGQIEAFSTVLASPAVQTAMQRLQQGISGITGSMSGLTNSVSSLASSLDSAAVAATNAGNAARYIANAADIAYANNPALRAAEEAIHAGYKAQEAWAGVSKTIQGEIDRLRGGSQSDRSLASIEAGFSIATAQARAGDLNALSLLPGLSQQLDDAKRNSATTFAEYRRGQLLQANSLEQTIYGGSTPFDKAVDPRLIALPQANQAQAVAYNSLESKMAALVSVVEGLKDECARGTYQSRRTADALQRAMPDGDAIATREAT
jgi:tape measure domain-containing protein